MTREQAIAFDSVRRGLGVANDEDVAAVEEPVDWSEVLAQIHSMGLVGLSAEAAFDFAPASFRDQLQRDAGRLVRINLFRSAETLRLLGLLEEHDIPVVPFKGAVLADRYYGSVSRRFFWDIDLLIAREHVLPAKQLLVSHGYEPEYWWTAAEERAELERNCEYNLDHPATGTHVELHWRFVPRYIAFDLDEAALHDRYLTTEFMARSIRVVPPEELLVIMCVHNGAKHQWDSLRAVCDVDRIVTSTADLDWTRVRGLCEHYRVNRIVRVGLALAQTFFMTRLPPPEERWVARDRWAMALCDEHARRLFGPRTEWGELEQPSAIEHTWRYLRSRERDRDRLRYLPFVAKGALSPTEKEASLVNLPAGWQFLYVFVRPWRLTTKYVRRYLFGGRSRR